jgi:hypothetical protein
MPGTRVCPQIIRFWSSDQSRRFRRFVTNHPDSGHYPLCSTPSRAVTPDRYAAQQSNPSGAGASIRLPPSRLHHASCRANRGMMRKPSNLTHAQVDQLVLVVLKSHGKGRLTSASSDITLRYFL